MCIWRNAIQNWSAHPLMAGDKVRANLQAIFQQVPIELDRQPAVVAKAVLDIQSCRTALMGGHVARCEDCNYEHFHYHSCRNRHCPLCQSRRREQWVNARRASLLPVAYFHVVFTLPHDLNQLIQGNPRMLYRLLFQQANQTLQYFAHKYLGGRLGITMVLHTWGQNLSQHVHVHCLVTAGALTDEGTWKATPKGYLFPAKALRNWFRRGYLDGLKALHGELRFGGALAHLKDDAAFNRWLTPLYQKTWSFHIKPPFAGPKHLIGYLGRYTHRTAISNQRIQSFDGRRVTFLWRDYRDGDQVKPMTLQVAEFTRRFLLHILPRGMARIRHYGLNANRANRARQAARRALRAPEPEPPIPETLGDWFLRITGHCIDRCPRCKIGRLKIVKTIPRRARDPPRLFSQLK